MQANKVVSLRRISLTGAILFVVGTHYAQADAETDAVKAAQGAYMVAIDSLDPAKLEALWVHDDSVVDYEPSSKSIAVGWDAVKKNLEDFPVLYTELKNTLAEGPYVQVNGDLARAVTKTAVSVKFKDGNVRSGEILQTDIYKKQAGAWLLVSHSASRAPK